RLASGWDRAVSLIRSLPSRAVRTLARLGGLLTRSGHDGMQAFTRAIRSGVGALVSAVATIDDAAVAAVRSALGIASPSRVFTEIGRQTGLGLASGMDDRPGEDAIRRVVDPDRVRADYDWLSTADLDD